MKWRMFICAICFLIGGCSLNIPLEDQFSDPDAITVFIVAVAFGMFLIMVAMVLHIINAVRGKNMESAWFDPNGAAGLVFYLALYCSHCYC
mgnify:CR=1 FL=1